jgi:hypothetical protein
MRLSTASICDTEATIASSIFEIASSLTLAPLRRAAS